jgi:AcrR family transcriptional regulator
VTTTDTLSARDHILDAAESLFASKGFGPSTIKEIGARAGLNPALLYYYFGSKEELYQAVLRRLGERLVARGSAAFEAATPAEAIRSLVNAQLEFLRAHPNVPKLVVRELVDHDAHHAQAVILQIAAGLFQRLCGVIERGQREGSFRRDVEPRFAAVSIIA